MSYQIKSMIDILEMCKLVSEFNPKLFRKKAKKPFSRADETIKVGGDIGFISVVCISALFSGTRFYYSTKRYSVYGAEGVESFEIKSKEMCEYYNLAAEAFSLFKNNEWYAKRLAKITEYVDFPIEEFFRINNDESAGLDIIFYNWCYNPDGTFKRLFIEWHGCNESSLEVFHHFYDYAVRIRECIPKVKALLDAYKRNQLKMIKGEGINGQQNHIGDNSSLNICA